MSINTFSIYSYSKNHLIPVSDSKNMLILYSTDVKEYVVKAQILAGGRGKGHFDNGFKGKDYKNILQSNP